jgi:hypothetical protein
MREFQVVNYGDRVRGASNMGAYWLQESAGGDGHIDADNDSVFSPKLEFVIDLSEATASILGHQASQMAAYRIHSITVGVRPVDDLNDNDESAFFAGRWLMYPHTKHGEEMLKLARSVERASEASEIDGDSLFLSTTNSYKSFRYNWSNPNQIVHATSEAIQGVMAGEWDLETIRQVYALREAKHKDRSLTDTSAPYLMSHGWVCALASGVGAGDSPPFGGATADHTLDLKAMDILGGFIKGEIQYSSGDEEGTIDDDYEVHVSVVWTPEVSTW